MVAFNFTQFVDKVENRTKCRTIRKTKRGDVGQSVQLYTGMRTKACRKLVEEDAQLIIVEPITIFVDEISGVSWWNRHRFAQLDGFETFQEFREFFKSTYGLPFSGWLHVWYWPEGEDAAADIAASPRSASRQTLSGHGDG